MYPKIYVLGVNLNVVDYSMKWITLISSSSYVM